MLTDDGALLIKIWLHVSRKTQHMQLAEEAPRKQQNPRVPGDPKQWWKRYPKAMDVSEQLIRATDVSHSPWHLVEAEDRYYRDVTVNQIILDKLTSRLAITEPERPAISVSDVRRNGTACGGGGTCSPSDSSCASSSTVYDGTAAPPTSLRAAPVLQF